MTLSLGAITIDELTPIVDGAPSSEAWIEQREIDGRHEIVVVLRGGGAIDAIGVRVRARGARRYLRSGYTSWDGSFFVDVSAARTAPAGDRTTNGYAMTALLPKASGAVVLGFLCHDRFQSRLRFSVEGDDLRIDLETLIDRVPHAADIRSETLVVFAGDEVEESLRMWARLVAAASPLSPRVPERRCSGWCSWYNLYSSLSEPV